MAMSNLFIVAAQARWCWYFLELALLGRVMHEMKSHEFNLSVPTTRSKIER